MEEKGNIDPIRYLAYLNFGEMCYKGLDVEKNDLLALNYFKKSGEMGNSKALFKIGTFYADGKCVEKDYKKALECFERSAKKGNPDAIFYLGRYHAKGK